MSHHRNHNQIKNQVRELKDEASSPPMAANHSADASTLLIAESGAGASDVGLPTGWELLCAEVVAEESVVSSLDCVGVA